MAKYGPHFTYWSRDYNVEPYRLLERLAAAGATCTELHSYVIDEWPDAKLDDFRKAYEDMGMEISYCGGYGAKTDIMSADPALRRAGADFMMRCVKFNHKMHAGVLDSSLVQTWNTELSEGRTKEQALADAVESLRDVVKAAEDYGVTLCMEILNRFEGATVNTMAEGLEVLRAFDSPNVKVTADIFHMNIEEDSIREAIHLGGNKIGLVHLGEANRRLPGNGSMIDWDELFSALGEVGYDGMFIFEAFVLAGGEVARDVKLRRDLSGGVSIKEMTAQAKKSIEFVKDKFERR